jgi:hypothetical protein
VVAGVREFEMKPEEGKSCWGRSSSIGSMGTFELPTDLEEELLESIAEADRGEVVDVDEVLRRLRRID